MYNVVSWSTHRKPRIVWSSRYRVLAVAYRFIHYELFPPAGWYPEEWSIERDYDDGCDDSDS